MVKRERIFLSNYLKNKIQIIGEIRENILNIMK